MSNQFNQLKNHLINLNLNHPLVDKSNPTFISLINSMKSSTSLEELQKLNLLLIQTWSTSL